jgi:HPt (histidine-containing phosphotransfer) domain-containing protein
MSPETKREPQVCDFRAALEKFDGDNEFVNEICGLILSHTPELMGSLKSAIDQEDWQSAANHAHTIKGSVSNLCSEPIYAAALRLEQICHDHKLDQVAEAHHDLNQEVDLLMAALKSHLNNQETVLGSVGKPTKD